MKANTLAFGVWLNELEPGSHTMRKTTKRTLYYQGEVAREVVSEPRPDWGQYLPVVTLPALERYIRAQGLAPDCGPNEMWSYGFTGGL